MIMVSKMITSRLLEVLSREAVFAKWQLLLIAPKMRSIIAILFVLRAISLADLCRARIVTEPKLPVPEPQTCFFPGTRPPPPLPWQTARECEHTSGPSRPIACPKGAFVADVPNGRNIQFQNGQIDADTEAHAENLRHIGESLCAAKDSRV